MANSTGTSHSLQGLEWPTQKPACEALSFSFAATLRRTLNRTFHPPHHRGKPLNDDREREIPPLGPMTPFCCQAGVSVDRESNMASCRWNADEGHGTVQRGAEEGRSGRNRERGVVKLLTGSPVFPVQIKSSTEKGLIPSCNIQMSVEFILFLSRCSTSCEILQLYYSVRLNVSIAQDCWFLF